VESSLKRISSKFLWWKRNDSSVVLYTWSQHGKPAASARARLRKANAEHSEIIFSSEFAICSQYQNVEATEMYVCAQLRDLHLKNRCAMAKSDLSCVEKLFFPGSRHCALVLQPQVPKLCTDLDLSLFYILILETYSKFARKNNSPALGVCFSQPCSSAGCRFAVLLECWLQVCRVKITFFLQYY